MAVLRRVMQAAIDDFVRRVLPRKSANEEWVRALPDLREAVRVAGMAVDRRGKRESHQARRKRSTLEEVTHILTTNVGDIARSKDFDDVYLWVDKLVGDINDVGALYKYDMAATIAVKMGYAPAWVYLHAGAAEGASHFGVQKKTKRIRPSDLPPPLSSMSASDLEDILCIYKHCFAHNRLPDGSEDLICFPKLNQETDGSDS